MTLAASAPWKLKSVSHVYGRKEPGTARRGRKIKHEHVMHITSFSSYPDSFLTGSAKASLLFIILVLWSENVSPTTGINTLKRLDIQQNLYSSEK